MYSISGIFTKLASGQTRWFFLLFYGLSLFVLAVYAVVWQFLLQRFKLSEAFTHKGIVVIWGILWGILLFSETLSVGKILAAALIIAGIGIRGKENE
jgi:multidrug transporter EmrE-like cation transporter